MMTKIEFRSLFLGTDSNETLSISASYILFAFHLSRPPNAMRWLPLLNSSLLLGPTSDQATKQVLFRHFSISIDQIIACTEYTTVLYHTTIVADLYTVAVADIFLIAAEPIPSHGYRRPVALPFAILATTISHEGEVIKAEYDEHGKSRCIG